MNCVNHPDRERIAFCQNCGRALCTECSRTVGAAVFCEPCLEARLRAAAGVAPGVTSAPPVPPPFTVGYRYVDPATGMPVVRAFSTHEANPWLAAFLGLIPGVGAMYNEQYAKGVVHLAVFAVLVSLADNHDIFGLFVAGWVFYMAIEAYHTARARRDGLPLPNPFGLNDIGERLGFGRHSWPMGAPAAPPVTPPISSAPSSAGSAPQAASSATPGTPPEAAWTAVPPTYSGYPPMAGTAAPPMPSGYVPVPGPLDVGIPHPGSRLSARFPVGAIWLIGLGVLFLLGNSGLFHGLMWFSGRSFVPLLLIGIAVWVFYSRMTGGGRSLGDDGVGDYRYRLFRAIRGAAGVGLTGILFFLNDFDILSWVHSWPLYLIVFGALAILQRSGYATPPAPMYPYVAPPVAVPMTPTPRYPPTSTSPFVSEAPLVEPEPGAPIIPPHENAQADSHPDSHPNQEGR